MFQEWESDKMREDPSYALVCFDLENVINFPKQKLNVYNPT